MDRSILRVSRLLLGMGLLLLLLLAPVGVAVAQVSTPAAADDGVYVDPEQRFQIPIPTNWVAEEQDGFVRITAGDGKISVSAGIVDAPGATSGIDTFMRLIDADFENAALQTLLATPTNGVDGSAVYTFDDGAQSGQLLQGLGRRVGEQAVFVLVLQGDAEAIGLRQVQVDKIIQGIVIRTESEATPAASPAA